MKATPEQLAATAAQREVNAEILRRHLKPGDVLTHTVCGGTMQEHRFISWSSLGYLIATATRDTMIITHRAGGYVDRGAQISPVNISHVNRERIDALDELAAMMGRDPIHAAGPITDQDLPL